MESLQNILTHIYDLFVGEDYDIQEEIHENKKYIVIYDCNSLERKPVLRVLKEEWNDNIRNTVEDLCVDLDEGWR